MPTPSCFAARTRALIALFAVCLAHSLFAQAIWSGDAAITGSLTLNGGANLFSSPTVTVNDDSQQLQYYNSGGAGDYWFEFNLTDGDAPGYSSSTGNLRFYLNSQNNSWTTIPNGRIVFSFQLPAAVAGTITGFSVLSDNRSLAPSFSVTSNGSGLLTFTQIADINFGGSGPAANLIGTFTTTAVPEPSTYAALAGLLALGYVALQRRRRA